MEKFLNEMRAKSDEAYAKALPMIDSYLKSAISNAAEKGLREAIVRFQGSDTANQAKRRCEEFGLKMSFHMRGTWATCIVNF